MIIPVILGGGVGSRLWPLSRSAYPKQYNAFLSESSLFQETLTRAALFGEECLVVSGEEHRFLVSEQLEGCVGGPASVKVLLEPARRDTAPAVSLAAWYAVSKKKDPLLLIMPADHVIAKESAFIAAVQAAQSAALAGKLVTFGCLPDRASTAYGYIQAGAPLDTEQIDAEQIHTVARFLEKPDAVTAAQLIVRGDYYWNCGIFLFRASAFLSELKQHAPEMYQCTETAMAATQQDGCFLRPEKNAFLRSPSNSLDYAVMEKTQEAAVVPIEMGWSDVGSWDALHEHLPQDDQGNTCTGEVFLKDVKNSYVRSSGRMIVGLGLENKIVVETRDAVLVADKSKSEAVKQLVQQLEQKERSETQVHAQVYRPWGGYETLEMADRFQVKCITVKPGASLSLQMHHQRSEHWVVISGTAEVTRGDEVIILGRDQSTYIPTQTKHRLKNIGESVLKIIEVQVGDYLGEDDIVRFEDNYGRVAMTKKEDESVVF